MLATRADSPGSTISRGSVSISVAVSTACRASIAAILVTKKSGSRGTHSQNPFGYEGVLTVGNIAISGLHARVNGAFGG
jgi:hypothetical protein